MNRQGEQHGHRSQLDIRLSTASAYPIVDLERRRNRDDQRRGGEEEPEIGVHAADIHMMRPHDEAQRRR